MYCNQAYSGWDMNVYKQHPNHEGDKIDFPGIYIQLDFLTQEEEQYLIENIDSVPWSSSQSGRRKQNYGPKCNFKKKKIKLGTFEGFPSFTKFIQDKFHDVPIMKDFFTIEQCSLEYDPKTGASIDPHIDDCWVWGERIVTVNLMSDSVLTLTYNERSNYYNLACVNDYPSVVDIDGNFFPEAKSYCVKPFDEKVDYPVVRIPMPRRSLLVMYGSPRYDWEHQIFRDDIKTRRICLAYREFTPPFLDDSTDTLVAKDILNKAKNFF
ncbi:hypothetical protein HHI36_009284 [Cryptolaemus montrouzieri]|uniref:Uncharacterized protein n=1 Tax=Cryptolaemus montrouzieri TaxID=559131 RepID=A0ABD2MUS2_9CUCU